MRIVCDTCAALYAIDDALIVGHGVHGQCPRCGHVQPLPAPSASPAPTERITVELPLPGDGGTQGPWRSGPASETVRVKMAHGEATSLIPRAQPRAPWALDAAGPDRGSRPERSRGLRPARRSLQPAPGPQERRLGLNTPVPNAGPPTVMLEQESGPYFVHRCSECARLLEDPFDRALGECQACHARRHAVERDAARLDPDLTHRGTELFPPPAGKRQTLWKFARGRGRAWFRRLIGART